MGRATEPVFIFLPIRERDPDSAGMSVDPVCGRAITESSSAGRLLYEGRQHYFCSLTCAEHFVADPAQFGPG